MSSRRLDPSAQGEISELCKYITILGNDKFRLNTALVSQGKDIEHLKDRVRDLTEQLHTQIDIADVAVSQRPKLGIGSMLATKYANRAQRLKIQTLKDAIEPWKVLGNDSGEVATARSAGDRNQTTADWQELIANKDAKTLKLKDVEKEAKDQVQGLVIMLDEAQEMIDDKHGEIRARDGAIAKVRASHAKDLKAGQKTARELLRLARLEVVKRNTN